MSTQPAHRITTAVAMLALIATSSSRRCVTAFQFYSSRTGVVRSLSSKKAISLASCFRVSSNIVNNNCQWHPKSIRFMSAVSEGDYSSLKVAELRDLLRERGLPVSGTKSQLIDRLSTDGGAEDDKGSVMKTQKLKSIPKNLVFEEGSEDDDFSSDDEDDEYIPTKKSRKGRSDFDPNMTTELSSAPSRSFKQDFQGTRVFVQDLPVEATWKELKDHFQVAGEVVFASVSIDSKTGQSKQCGIVQFETSEMARKAIKIMRDHPMDGKKLFVREDVQESRSGSGGNQLRNSRKGKDRSSRVWDEDEYKENLPSEWRRANDDDDKGDQSSDVPENVLNEIKSIIKKRDMERRRKNYRMSDEMREQLKFDFGVHLDDRLKLWWTSSDGHVPDLVSDIKGEGRWGKQKPWRQIPTTPEYDALVDSDLVFRLLAQRDKARKMKDFDTADNLLQKAYDAPQGELGLRIHDESRTWRIWTDKPPPRKELTPSGGGYEELTPAEMCIKIVTDNEPEKVEEMESLLKKFPGREWNILKKLKQRYD